MSDEGPKRSATLINSGGFKLSTTSGTLDIHAKELHTELVNKIFLYHTGSFSSISSAFGPGASSIAVTAATSGMVNSGDFFVITESGTNITETLHAKIVSQPSALVLNLDRQLCNSYSQSAQIEQVIENMATASLTDSASPENPIIFKIAPQNTVVDSSKVWNITRMNIAMEDATTPTDDLFGGMAALTNGVSVVENKAQNVQLSHWHKNGDMILDSGVDVEYHQKGTGGTNHGVRGRWTLVNAGIVSRIHGTLSESLEIWIQDDISDLVEMRIKAQGNIEINAL